MVMNTTYQTVSPWTPACRAANNLRPILQRMVFRRIFTDEYAKHWTEPAPPACPMRIDGTTYRLMGPNRNTLLTQVALEVPPTRTITALSAPARLLTFTMSTPLHDLDQPPAGDLYHLGCSRYG